ncbi:EAL domain-containing protein [Vibrio nigripulchritudo]|uniref:EAL domain-containing protein n=1 Tax=Vibrio nigripulchritudo TaxID=28173 RepID=UPI0024926A77|nr:EAL domain-containing protein [Vibrio nigripulchritudo]BDU40993.1 diguanylate phosphodiesterase [Vibrio nigripulchritudo]BDU46733.1 diguanylate phosphodiesterase [Vibrio nigripulchritudo]
MKVVYNTQEDPVQDIIFTDEQGWSYSSFDGITFKGVYQPIFDRQNNIHAYEGLVRITDQNGDVVSPDDYLKPIRGDLKKLMLFFLITGKIHFQNFSRFYLPEQSIFINAPPCVFNTLGNSLGAIEQLLIRLQALGVPKENVVYEIMEDNNTEMSLMAQGIANLKEVDIRVALDDFGSMGCDMARVRRHDVNIVKIDKAMVQNFVSTRSQIWEVLDYCQSRNITTIAEGIETQEQLAIMKEWGVDYFQGYLLGKPISAQNILGVQSQQGSNE